MNGLETTASAAEILAAVGDSLREFSYDAEQSDDITMIAVKFEGRNKNG